jgi:hypothetical protein
LFIDALDEIRGADLRSLLDFLAGIRRYNCPSLHLVVTSQPQNPTIHLSLGAYIDVKHQVNLEKYIDRDIHWHIREALHKSHHFRARWSSQREDILKLIENRLQEASEQS